MRHPILLLLVASFCAVSVADEQPAFPLNAKRILFLGDSITNSGYYVAHIETQLRIQGVNPVPEIINIGLPSETCSGLSEPDHPFPRPDVHERLERALNMVQPDVVVACYGMNDGIYYPFGQDRFAAYRDGISKLVAKVHAAGAKLVLVTPPPFDPVPLHDKPGKLLPAGADKYAWFAIYENYDDVLKRYAKFVMENSFHAEMVVDVHTPLNEFLAEQRRRKPDFSVSTDGVHMNEAGHEIMSAAILKAWGVESWETPSAELRKLMKQQEGTLHDAWLSHVGHQRPGVKAGLPLEEAQEKVEQLEKRIKPLIEAAGKPQGGRRPSTGGEVYHVHYPASQRTGELRLFADYFLWIPAGLDRVNAVIVHQHGCGPGASVGGQTAADDLHWQALARKTGCALMGSSYEPRRGVNCRLWCDARNGSEKRFLQAIKYFAAETGHAELASAPWCLWGHSGGGFWASLMQTLHPQRIVAIWLQSGTAYGYWKSGEISTPHFSDDVYAVPVMGNPGGKEKDHERFHVAYQGTQAMRDEYIRNGAAFFEFAPDPLTGHECGDSRYLSIPFFEFWLAQRVPREGGKLKPVTDAVVAAWTSQLGPKLAEFIRTGSVSDETPPPPPEKVMAERLDDGRVRVTWTARADLESGLREFLIARNGKPVGRIPEKPVGRFGRPLFQAMSYHDTPEQPLPEMQFLDNGPVPADAVYSVSSVNSVNLKSIPVESNWRDGSPETQIR